MTAFLCLCTAAALISTPSVRHGSAASVVAVFAAWTLLVLGLATIAVWTWVQ